jgi:ketopantoate reductase
MTEHDHILGAMVNKGIEKGVPCDLLKAAHTQLFVAQASRQV